MKYAFGNLRESNIPGFAEKLAGLAVRALVTEVCTTPKPGLVDRANCGAHGDMDIFTFIDSAIALYPYFRNVTTLSLEHSGTLDNLLATLQPIGIQAEHEMFHATNGVNTHKGAIFSLGVICAAVAVLAIGEHQSLPATCAAIAKARSRGASESATGGEIAFAKHGIEGILGEAAAGFPAVFDTALPAIREHTQRGESLQDAAVVALLHLIATVDDTNIVARRGIDVLRDTQEMVAGRISGFVDASQYLQYAKELDGEFIRQNISPGGCADLLAASLLVDYVLHETAEYPDPPCASGFDGTRHKVRPAFAAKAAAQSVPP